MKYKKEKLFTLQSTFSFTVIKYSGIYIPSSLVGAIMAIVNSLYSPDSTPSYVTTLNFATVISGLSTFCMLILMFIAYAEAPTPSERKKPQFILASAFAVRASGIITSQFLYSVASATTDAEISYGASISQAGNIILSIMEIGGLLMLALVAVRVFKGVLFVALGGTSVVIPLMFQQARELISVFKSLGSFSSFFDAVKANINTTSIILLFLFTVLYFMETVKQERKRKKQALKA